jgi:F420H(2)-dependent quinone reductase
MNPFKFLFYLFTRFQILIFRFTGGRALASMRGMPVLLLTTTGRKTGKRRTTPLMYIRDGEKYVITASNSGSDHGPAWYRNLLAEPGVEVDVPGRRLHVQSAVAKPAEHEKYWAQLVTRAPFFEAYRKGTSRHIPIVILTPQ